MKSPKKNWATLSPSRVTVAIAFMLVLLVAWLIYEVFRDDPQPIELTTMCLAVLPADKRVGMKFERRGDTVTMDLSGQRGVQAGATPEQIEGFVKCIEATARVRVAIDNGVRLSLEPVGQLANRWKREAGPKVTLMPGPADEILNNIRIGPATGLKEDVIRAWCQQAAACVSCEPDQPSSNTVEVLVRLRDRAPVEKNQMPGRWPVPQPGSQSEIWQMVNEKGERSYYECKG